MKKALLLGIVLLIGELKAPARAAINCSKTMVKPIPWQWNLTQTTGPSKNNTSIFIENLGPIFTIKNANGSLGGYIKIDKTHNPGVNCGRVGQLPNTANVIIKGVLDGIYSNTTLGGSIEGAIIETYTRAQASATYIGDLPTFSEGTGSGNFSLSKEGIFQLGLGTHPYVGTIASQTKYGFGLNILGVGDFINLFAKFTYNATLTHPNPIFVDYRYPAPIPVPTPAPNPLPVLQNAVFSDYSSPAQVPAPLPVMGAGAAFGFVRKLRTLALKRD